MGEGDFTINVGVDTDSRWLLRWAKLSGLNIPRLKSCPFCGGNRISIRASDEEGNTVYDGQFLDCWMSHREGEGISTDTFKSNVKDPNQLYTYDLDRVLADVSSEEMDAIAGLYMSYVSLDCECGCALYQSVGGTGIMAIPKLFAKWQKRV